MIGFKTVDNFSFDECVVFLNGYDDKDASRAEINQRYLQLLTQFQREDESAFKTCKTHDDYKNYLHRFTNISGATNYRPLHEEEAKEFLRTHPAPHPIPTPTPTPETGFFSAYWTGAKKRNCITNIVLYILLFASLAVALLLIPDTIRSLIHYFENDCRFINVYRYGLIPVFLLATAFIGISKIIKWKRSGMPIMIISLFIIIFPTIFNEYLEFVKFSVYTLSGLALVWGILKLKKKGWGTWKMCREMPRWAIPIQFTVLIIWGFMITILPPAMALYTGFNANLYSNGMRCLDARLNDSSYYSYDLYQRILLNSDFPNNKYDAQYWLNKAKILNTDNTIYDNEFSEPVIFLYNLIFEMKTNGDQAAIEYIDSKQDYLHLTNFDLSDVFQYINHEKHVSGYYEYICPNKDNLIRLLHDADVYSTVPAEIEHHYETAK